uniref:Uncharacterized protein n=1 Tax=Plectus sambesii TaxID=2011161 RepID=A0A914W529_9BILA
MCTNGARRRAEEHAGMHATGRRLALSIFAAWRTRGRRAIARPSRPGRRRCRRLRLSLAEFTFEDRPEAATGGRLLTAEQAKSPPNTYNKSGSVSTPTVHTSAFPIKRH